MSGTVRKTTTNDIGPRSDIDGTDGDGRVVFRNVERTSSWQTSYFIRSQCDDARPVVTWPTGFIN